MEFNNRSIKTEQAKIHQKDFEMEVPVDYFKESKKSIIDLTIAKRKKTKLIQLLSFTSVAASLLIAVLLLTNKKDTEQNFAINEKESEILINALFADDDCVEQLTDAYMFDGLYVENDVLN